MLLLQTFGGLSLSDATTHTPIGAPRRKPLALLALVAEGRHRGVEREWVMAMLWPELTEARARRALSQTLYALRRELGADAHPRDRIRQRRPLRQPDDSLRRRERRPIPQ